MGLRVKTYFTIVVLLLTIASVYLSTQAVIVYILFFLLSSISLNLLYTNLFYIIPLLLIIGSIFISYFIRPFILYQDPTIFMFYDKVPILKHDLDQVMWDILISAFCVICGYIAVTKPFDQKKKLLNQRQSIFVLKYFLVILFLLVALMGLKLFLFFGLGIGLKGEKITSPLAFLARFIPVDLIYAVIGLYFFKYGKILYFKSKVILAFIILGFSFAILVTGSKSFILVFAFCYGVYLLFNDVRIKIGQFFLLAIGGFILFVVSFVAAGAIKFAAVTGQDYAFVFNFALQLLGEVKMIDIFGDITARFIGMDGYLIINKFFETNNPNLQDLQNVFSISETFYRSIDMTIPMVKSASTLSDGVAIGRFVHGYPPSYAFSGAVGLFASLQLMFGSLHLLGKFLFGAGIGLFFVSIRKVRDSDMQFILYTFGGYFTLFSTMSGNFDFTLSLLYIKVILLFAYVVLVRYLQPIKNAVLAPPDFG